jgi:hypothetical protein
VDLYVGYAAGKILNYILKAIAAILINVPLTGVAIHQGSMARGVGEKYQITDFNCGKNKKSNGHMVCLKNSSDFFFSAPSRKRVLPELICL